MEDDNIDNAPKRLLMDFDCRLEYEWVEFSWNRYTEIFIYPINDDYYDDFEFLFLCENHDDDDDDFMFDLLCEEMDEIFSQ